MAGNNVELGCGLIAIGRPWGTTPEVPTEKAAIEFLESAYESGVRHFDTAPSYGDSEAKLGLFLDNLTTKQRNGVTVATKVGEHWDVDVQVAYTDHSKEAMMRSIGQSISRLGAISLMQIHKANVPVIRSLSGQLDRVTYHMLNNGMKIGASVSDAETGYVALQNEWVSAIQLPYNQRRTDMTEIIRPSVSYGCGIVVNRPFAEGYVVAEAPDAKRQAAVDAFAFILEQEFNGVVLTGTSNDGHLQENLEAFTVAKADRATES